MLVGLFQSVCHLFRASSCPRGSMAAPSLSSLQPRCEDNVSRALGDAPARSSNDATMAAADAGCADCPDAKRPRLDASGALQVDMGQSEANSEAGGGIPMVFVTTSLAASSGYYAQADASGPSSLASPWQASDKAALLSCSHLREAPLHNAEDIWQTYHGGRSTFDVDDLLLEADVVSSSA
eukprot:TRINITY_DN59039_c0_g1_i1.p1 TRINITY_DN59039_c0_g1~~TRINITY_DN59039_c0_g1_i1.p1  ORF type:complete len:188 (+),score=31.63 TRINITY_DN59039_c0_g1_i1:24-566(+)